MKEEILQNLQNPSSLEKLYRNNRSGFKKSFNELYDQLKANPVAQSWHERLNYESQQISWGSSREFIYMILACMLAGLIVKLPALFKINEEIFYSRNISFIVFPILSAYFIWKYPLDKRKILIISVATVFSILFVNLFPDNSKSDTLLLTCIHLPFFIWFLMGWSYVGPYFSETEKRIDFLRYNGDLVVISALIVIAIMLLAGITNGLFSLLGYKMEEFYFENFVFIELAATPIIGTYIIEKNPQLVNKVSPVIAKIFSPLVLLTLIAYLIAILYSKKDPFNDREFLLAFNALLAGVIALIFFSVVETSKGVRSKSEQIILSALSILAILINGIALSAILYRIGQWGFTPNRMAVLGGNLLFLIHLSIIAVQLIKSFRHSFNPVPVERSITSFLPVYFLWSFMVAFIFPLIFGFK